MSDNPNVAVQGSPEWYVEELRTLADNITGRGVGICNGAALMIERQQAALEAQASDGDGVANCAECGAFMELVRPGKYQHPTCSQASAPGGEVTEWRDAFIHVSAMRYIDNGMMHDAAYEAAEQDARVTESANRAALAARTGKGESARQQEAARPTAQDAGAAG